MSFMRLSGPKPNQPWVTVHKDGRISFNATATKRLGISSAQRVEVSIDEEKRLIIVEPVENGGKGTLAVSDYGWGKGINTKSLFRRHKVEHPATTHYGYRKDGNLIVIDLNKPLEE